MLKTGFTALTLSFLLGSLNAQGNTKLSIGVVDSGAGTVDVHISNPDPVAGFQFRLADGQGAPLPLSGASAGPVVPGGFMVSASPTNGVVLGFCICLDTIAPTSGSHPLLVQVQLVGAVPPDLCLTEPVISAPAGIAMPAEVAGCVSIPYPDCNGNGIDDGMDLYQESSLDLDANGAPDECQALSADVGAISLSAGGTQALSLDAGPGFGAGIYLVLGSASGTSPGIPLDGNLLPLNLDAYLLLTLSNVNVGPYKDTFGFLDIQGRAAASIILPAGTSPSLAGLQLDHAFAVIGVPAGVVFASNAMPLSFEL